MTDKITDPVAEVVDEAEKTVTTDPIPAPVADPVKPVTDKITSVTKEAADTVAPVTKVVDEATKPVTDVTGETTDPVTDIVDDIVDGAVAPGVVTPPTQPRTTAGGRPQPRTERGEGDGERDQRPAREPASSGARDAGSLTFPQSIVAGASASVAERAATASSGTSDVATGSAAERVGRAIVEASRAFSFPLAVAALLLLFLAIQGRVDARDPKLAATEEEELVFV